MTGLTIDATSSATAVRASHDDPPSRSTFTGTRRLLWLVLRRDRFRIAMWMFGLVGLMAVSASSIVALYTTPEELEGYARTVRGNSALIIQAGPGYGLDDPTLGAVVMNETAQWMFIAAGGDERVHGGPTHPHRRGGRTGRTGACGPGRPPRGPRVGDDRNVGRQRRRSPSATSWRCSPSGFPRRVPSRSVRRWSASGWCSPRWPR